MTAVLDASAMIAFLRDEPGADTVDALLNRSEVGYAHSINLCEVYYDCCRRSGPAAAWRALEDLFDLGVIEDASLSRETWREAGALKARLRRVSLADCFAIGLARRLDAPILTADHHEFDALADEPGLTIRFIR